MATNDGSIPSHVNVSDLVVYNQTPEMNQMLQMILDGLQNGSTGKALVGEQWVEGVRVVLNPLDGVAVGNSVPDDIKAKMEQMPGRDFFDAETHAIYINPYSALEVKDNSGNIVGVDSAVVAYGHEVAHSIDPNSIDHTTQQPTAGYPNVGEYLAGQYEQMIAQELGEPVRTNHGGTDILVNNPTQHTTVINGETYWIKTGLDGRVELGAKYNFQDIPRNGDAPGQAPSFGSTDPGHAADNNHPSADESGQGPGGPDSGSPRDDGDTGGYVADPDGGYTDLPDAPPGWNPLDPEGGGTVYTFKTGHGTSGAPTSAVVAHPAAATAYAAMAAAQVTAPHTDHPGFAALQQWMINGGSVESLEQQAQSAATKLVFNDMHLDHSQPVISYAPVDHQVELVGVTPAEHVAHALA